MTPSASPEVRPERGGDRLERTLAYAARDGSFALYNDLSAGRAVRVTGPVDAAFQELATLWSGESPAGAPRPLAPREAVEGYGTFTFPYGPISMGVPESGRFDVRTYGERVLELTPVGGFKARGIARAVVGARVVDAALRIERTVGNLSAAHVAAFLAAAESATQATVPTVELWCRALAQELQRVYNHLHVLARLAEAASQNVGAAQTHALAEEVLRLQARAFGHRWLFGALLPGGPSRRLEPADRRDLGTKLLRLGQEFDRLWELFVESRIFLDRIQGTCPVPRGEAVAWGAVGPTLRASGVPWDDRLRVPVLPYTDLFVELATERDGDALARLLVRARELRASLLLLEQLLDRWPSAGASEDPAAAPVAPARGIGRVESPSGDLVYDVTVQGDTVVALGLRTASQANWPAFAHGMREAVFTDFHFAFESFGLAFAETDG